MGLAEKKLIKEAQDAVVPGYQNKLKELGLAGVAIEVDWASFGEDGGAVQKLGPYAFDPLLEALKTICADAMGKEAVQGGLKKITLKHLPDGRGRGIAFSGGVYSVQDRFNGGEYFSSSKVQPVIEKAL